uniref:Uncharacterized protein n=1 Tax=Clastoptera arizonana TaxID=38151 RepID=A0A1B6CC75_9HEMI
MLMTLFHVIDILINIPEKSVYSLNLTIVYRYNMTTGLNTAIRKVIPSDQASRPIDNHMRHAVQVGDDVYVSGLLGVHKKMLQIVDGDVTAQTKEALNNLKNILKNTNCDFTNVVKATYYLINLEEWDEVANVLNKFLKEPYPVASIVQVNTLPMDARIQIDVTIKSGKLVA